MVFPVASITCAFFGIITAIPTSIIFSIFSIWLKIKSKPSSQSLTGESKLRKQ